MLKDFLSKLGAGTKITVGVSVSPSVGLEMIEIDRVTKTVSKYSSRPLDYNSSTREITNYEQFGVALEELFDELDIPRKSNIVLSLPNIHFGLINLPILLTDDAVTNAIISEVEQSYIFKRQEPIVSWDQVFSNANTENRTLAYTAIQKEALDSLIDVCQEIGCTLVGLENSYASLFKALDYIEVAKDQMSDGVSWNLVVIMQNNYSIISMSGKQVIEYYEEPLALKSFVDDEIYNAIKTSAQLTLAGLPANYLFIVSETDLVSAEVLAMGMQSDCPVKFLECNKFIQNELLPINLNVLQKKAMQITPEAIGVGVHAFSDYPLNLNILKSQDGLIPAGNEDYPKVNIWNLEVELTPDFLKKLSLIIGAVVLIPLIILYLFLLNVVAPKQQARVEAAKAKVDELSKNILKYQKANTSNTFDLKTEVNTIVGNNKLKMDYFEAIGISVPNKLWVTFFYMGGDGKIDIRGASSDVSSVYAFYKNLKQTVNNSNIRLQKLEINNGDIDNIMLDNKIAGSTYAFEITNMNEGELSPAATTPDATTTPGGTPGATPGPNIPGSTQNPATPNATGKKQFFQFGKPMFGSDMPQQQPGPVNPGPTTGPMPNAPMMAPRPMPMTRPMPMPMPPTPTNTGNGNLPPNLRKIEKF